MKHQRGNPTCSVPGCGQPADYEVLFEDVYLNVGWRPRFYRDRDSKRPYLCSKHQQENEAGSVGEVQPRGVVNYPHTNRCHAQGATGYRCLRSNGDHQKDQMISGLENWLIRNGHKLSQCVMVGGERMGGAGRMSLTKLLQHSGNCYQPRGAS